MIEPRPVALLLASAACALATAVAAAGEPRAQPNGVIAFSAGPFETGVTDIYTVRPDGGDLRKLTSGPGRKFDPALSPDGSEIVFRFQTGGDSTAEIYSMSVDGSQLRNLTRNAAMDYASSWSPDGRRIVFASTRGGSGLLPHIYVMNADGSHPRRMGRSTGEYPAWSPEGRRIAFAVNTGTSSSSFEIWTMRTDGSRPRRLTRNTIQDMGPAWSPSGKTIAFHHYVTGLPRIFVMRADGSHVHRLTRGPGELPDWSPDGRFIVYSASGLVVMRADGSHSAPLRVGALQEPVFPSWSVAR